MENHPIPQDVTGFQFKLIGDMTIKQFAYLASGAILGWIFFSLPINVLIKFPLAIIFVGLGISLAFLPVGGRPFDAMITYFMKALFSPNQYLFIKKNGVLIPQFNVHKPPVVAVELQKTNKQKLQQYLGTIPQQNGDKLDLRESSFLQSLPLSTQMTQSNSSVQQTPTQKPLPQGMQPASSLKSVTPDPNQTEEALDKESATLQEELTQAKAQENTPQAPQDVLASAHQKVQELEKQMQEVMKQKQLLEEQLLKLHGSFQTPKQQPALQPVPTTMSAQQPASKQTASQPMPENPNIITGTVKDPRGNILPNILVEVRDNQDNPVRAFKTNTLGQFASATPLANGAYTLIFEDPSGRNTFSPLQINASGALLAPVEISSVDKREELRKMLFS